MSSPREKLPSLPQKPGVYLFKDKNGTVLYVGKAKALRRRVASYFRLDQELKTALLVSKIADLDYIITASELDALILENELVKKYQPRYNMMLKDDKNYPFLKLTVNEEWPRLVIARRQEEDGALYFGRYQGGMARAIIKTVKKMFPLRWCNEAPLKKRTQPCLYYHVGSCRAPCVGKISQEKYQALVEGVKILLSGNLGQALQKLQEEMRRAAAAQDYERAGYFRDSLGQLEKMLEGKGEKKEDTALQDLKRVLALDKLPERIECFDISNLQAANMVGSLVVFLDGAPLKSDYRRFKIRSVKGKPNDFQAIYEVVKRRYTGTLAKKLPWPDLVVVDGGRPQVDMAWRALKEAGLRVPLLGLAKEKEGIVRPFKVGQLVLPRGDKGLQLLQRLRDEAHRFAINYHRKMRKQAFFS